MSRRAAPVLQSGPAVSCHRLSLTSPSGARVLDRIDLEIPTGHLVAVTGPSGSGTASLLKILSGLQTATSGEVTVLGSSLHSLAAGTSYVSRETALDPEMTGIETLNLFAALYRLPSDQRRRRIDRLISGFKLTTHAGRLVSCYSADQKRRLHLAVALLSNSKLLLLDRPVAGLDPQGRSMLWELLRRRAHQECTIIVSTDDLTAVEIHCDLVAILYQGRIAACGPPDRLRNRHANGRLIVELVNSPPNRRLLERRLAQLPQVEAVRGTRRQIYLEVSSPGSLRLPVLDVLNDLKLEAAALRAYRPDLAGAVFKLTGQVPTVREGAGGNLGRIAPQWPG